MKTLGELKGLLDDLGLDDDAPLRAAIQPSYPLGAYIDNVVEVDGTVWIAVSGGDDYDATREMWDA